ncbi:nidogen-like domain-containing protein, partial [uncultured Phenylobacterium sp.]|uniref:nidogen-like domain-containing protein n=1 Tax=uncultured Phenylobacterium sp. TaxID=349273 RepID=UPI0025D858A8
MPSLVDGLGGVAGFGEASLQPSDDLSSVAIDITSVFGSDGLYFNGAHYTTLYVNNNGNISFGAPNQSFAPTPFGASGPLMIAPFWVDLDTQGPDRVSPGGTSQGTNTVYYDLDAVAKVFTATWDDVGYKASSNNNPAAFQVQLIDMGDGDFDIAFIYERIGPPATDAGAPSAGWALGAADGTTVHQMVGSGDRFQMAALDTNPGNTGEAGRWLWRIRDGVLEGTGPPEPEPEPEPEPQPDPVDPTPAMPVSFGLSTSGLVREGDSGTTEINFTITRSGDLGSPSLVDWRIEIDDPSDFAPGQALSGVAFFGVGETQVVVSASVQGDKVFEADDMFAFRLSNAVHGLVVFDPNVAALGAIVNDDSPVMFAFSGPQMHAEGQAGPAPFDFVVVRSGDLTQGSTVEWELLSGKASADDFAPGQPLSGTVTFAPGAAQAIIRIQVAGDLAPEPDETFTVRLTQATTGGAISNPEVSAEGTIVDDDLRHALLVAAPTALVSPEGDAGATAFAYTLLRTGDVSLGVTIPYAIALL